MVTNKYKFLKIGSVCIKYLKLMINPASQAAVSIKIQNFGELKGSARFVCTYKVIENKPKKIQFTARLSMTFPARFIDFIP